MSDGQDECLVVYRCEWNHGVLARWLTIEAAAFLYEKLSDRSSLWGWFLGQLAGMRSVVTQNPSHRIAHGHYSSSLAMKSSRCLQTRASDLPQELTWLTSADGFAKAFSGYLESTEYRTSKCFLAARLPDDVGFRIVSLRDCCAVEPSTNGFLSIFLGTQQASGEAPGEDDRTNPADPKSDKESVLAQLLAMYDRNAHPHAKPSKIMATLESRKRKIPSEVFVVSQMQRALADALTHGQPPAATRADPTEPIEVFRLDAPSCTEVKNWPGMVLQQAFAPKVKESTESKEKTQGLTTHSPTQADKHAEPQLSFVFSPIGYFSSVYKEKFGTPRQSGLVQTAKGSLTLCRHIHWSTLEGLEEFSHAWIIFVFHQNADLQEATQEALSLSSPAVYASTLVGKVKPPKMQGQKQGAFATRAPHRFNPIGLTVARIDSVDLPNRCVYFSGADLLDGTPVLDIKPYHPADSLKLPAGLECCCPYRESQDNMMDESKAGHRHRAQPDPRDELRVPEWVMDNYKATLASTKRKKLGDEEIQSLASSSTAPVLAEVEFHPRALASLDDLLEQDYQHWEATSKGECQREATTKILNEFRLERYIRQVSGSTDCSDGITPEVIKEARRVQREEILDCIRETLAIDPRTAHSKAKFSTPGVSLGAKRVKQSDESSVAAASATGEEHLHRLTMLDRDSRSRSDVASIPILETLAVKLDGICVIFNVIQREQAEVSKVCTTTHSGQNSTLSTVLFRVEFIEVARDDERVRSRTWLEATLDRLSAATK